MNFGHANIHIVPLHWNVNTQWKKRVKLSVWFNLQTKLMSVIELKCFILWVVQICVDFFGP